MGILGVGLAASTGVFAVVDAVALRPLPYSQPEGLVRVGVEREGRPGLSTVSGPNFRDIAAQVSTLQSLAAVTPSTMGVSATGGPSELVSGAWVSGDFFAVLETVPTEGRTLVASDDRAAAPPAIVLSHALARRLFGEEAPVGRSLTIDDLRATVVGVMPRDFHPPEGVNLGRTALWVPLAHAPLPVHERGLAFLDLLGRLRPGVAAESAAVELAAIGGALIESHALPPRAFARLGLRPLRDETVGETGPLLTLLLTAVVLVLGIAVLNAANLTLLRALDRTDSLRLRMALGASKARVVAESAVEGALVGVLGGALGTALAGLALQAVARVQPVDLPRLAEVTVDARITGVALAVAIASGLLAGMVPAMAAVGGMDSPRVGRVRTTAPLRAHLLRDGVVVAQVALGLALAGSAALVGRSLAAFRATPLGLEAGGLHVATLRMDGVGGPDFEPAHVDDLVTAVRNQPGVVDAGVGSGSPYVPGGFVGYLVPDGVDVSPEERARARVEFHRVGGGALGLLGIQLMRGRDIAETDRADSEPVVVVSRAVAEAWWKGEDPLGRLVTLGGDGLATPRRVVGIAADPRYRGPATEPEQHVWIPWRQMPAAPLDLRVRVSGEVSPDQLVASAVATVPGVHVRGVRSVSASLAERYVEPTFFAALFGGFASIALVFAAVGLHSTLSQAVRARRAELGIRMALGADRARLTRRVILRGLAVAGVGVVAGGLLSLLGTRLTTSLLFGVHTDDPLAWSWAVVGVLVTALMASGVPAWSAGRTDPVESLRGE